MSAASDVRPAGFGSRSLIDLPAVAVRADRLEPTPASSFTRTHATPLLDRLASDRGLGTRAIRRRRSYEFDFAGGVVGIETSRLGAVLSDRPAVQAERSARKSWSAGLRSGWALGTDDTLSFGIAGATDHGPPRGLVMTYPHDVTSTAMIGLNWTHGDYWQAGLGWRQVGGTTHGTTDRMIELSNGAPLHEAGVGMSVAFLPGGHGDPDQTSIGFEARRTSIAADDLAQINANQRQVSQGALVLKTQF